MPELLLSGQIAVTFVQLPAGGVVGVGVEALLKLHVLPAGQQHAELDELQVPPETTVPPSFRQSLEPEMLPIGP